ncbi:TRAP transporter small permease [Gilvimarinus sp. SDUM040013]|uniref:TRAP transporter small permease protein n=1 Tax=Gilvimarinus gilvus TaxID=3058038 RepID=A0ABU4RXZ8_9GAMM|nr:TRAP transporter small permease [Gilvimarinus sp. SDUM040013]MDO3386257.1 TRAP transporter small permease [Gilvimarinus sp. SDUM040013]MDX6849748.1 TRAP transporter small permease [Gilvimarinus sp. SDUM040013]
MKSLMNIVEKFLGAFVGLLMAAMVVDVTWQVVTRFLLQEPSSYTEELARFLLVWIGLLGAAYAYRRKAHLGLDILSQKLEGLAKRKLDIFISIVCAIFASVIMIYGGSKLVLLTLELDQMSAALQVKVGYLYCVIPLSGFLIVMFSIDRIVNGDPEPEHLEFYE